MNISTIEQYVERKNSFAKLFGTPALSLLRAEDRQKIADSIDAELSPENLTCDGELSRSQVQQRYNFLTRAAQELQSIDPSVTFYEFNLTTASTVPSPSVSLFSNERPITFQVVISCFVPARAIPLPALTSLSPLRILPVTLTGTRP